MITAINKNKRIQWLLVLSGPVSLAVSFAITEFISRGPDGGWLGMASMFIGLSVSLIIHVLATIFLVILAIFRWRRRAVIGMLVISGLSYYALAAVISLVLFGGV